VNTKTKNCPDKGLQQTDSVQDRLDAEARKFSSFVIRLVYWQPGIIG
jgi:hypothetical protein